MVDRNATHTTRGLLTGAVAALLLIGVSLVSPAPPVSAGPGSIGSSGEAIGTGSFDTVPTVDAGSEHTCALSNTGQVSCWGNNSWGQLGTGDTTTRRTPTTITLPDDATATAVAAGSRHSCALLNTGEISCWGNNSYGRLGTGDNTDTNTPSDPITLPGGTTATAITVSSTYSCALSNTGEVSCWGRNLDGQLGTGDTAERHTPTAITLPDDATATAITTGGGHTCALLNTGEISCWGSNFYKALGTGDTTDRNTPTTITLPTGTTATAITAGGTHTCALLNTGEISCWGDNFSGQLGTGDNTDRNTPSDPITLPGGTAAITAGASYTCAVSNTGEVACWGDNDEGQLGTGDTTDRNTPTTIDLPGEGTTATTITAGSAHTCALLHTGEVACWGDNFLGQLGTGDTTDRYTPTTITLPTDTTATAITAGNVHTCALLNTGETTCWGRNFFGQLGTGDNTDTTTPSDPITLPDDSTATAITAGNSHTCTLLNTGQVTCWGDNADGQLGTGDNTDTTTPSDPITLPTGTTATAITAGGTHTCALLNTGEISCWGDNFSGQLGTGDNTDRNTPSDPITLPGGTAAITAGASYTCAVSNTGEVACWGDNFLGQLGTGDTTDRNTPTTIDLPGEGTTATTITAGSAHTCALLHTGEVACWGYNFLGQLGTGDTTDRYTPTTITLPTGTTATAITAGNVHTCALLNTGETTCWGRNFFGQLGTGDNTDTNTPNDPITLPDDSTATTITAGNSHTCTLLNTGRTTCWGDNADGQLGTGDTNDTNEPVTIGQPTVPTGFTGAPGDTTVQLDWEPPLLRGLSPVTGYQVGVATTADTCTTDTTTTGTELTVTDLTNGGDYWFCVAATNTNGTSPTTTTGPIVPSTTPTAPTGLAATPGDTTVQLDWNPPVDDGGTPVTGYQVGVATTADTCTTDADTTTTVSTTTGTELTVTDLTNGGDYWFCVAATNTNGTSPTTTTGPITPTAPEPEPEPEPEPVAEPAFTTVTPTRVLDTRTQRGFFTESWTGTSPTPAGTTITIPVRTADVPTDAAAVVVNLTTTGAVDPGYLTVFACDTPRPPTSNANFTPGNDTANLAIAPLSADGTICLYTSATADLIVDVVAHTGPGYSPTTPSRLTDTRTHSRPAAGDTIRVDLPDGNTHALTLTATRAQAPGYLTAHDCTDPRPATSNLNYTPGEDTANLTVVTADELCIHTSASVDVTIDHQGTIDDTNTTTPTRIVDTRNGDRLQPGDTIAIPDLDGTQLVNLTTTDTTTPGHLTLHACNTPIPDTSNTNTRIDHDVANLAITPDAPDTCVTTTSTTHLIIDHITNLDEQPHT